MGRRRPLEGGTLLPKFLDGNLVTRLEALERQGRDLARLGITGTAAAAAFGRRTVLQGWGKENLAANTSATKLYRFGNAESWGRDAVMSRGGTVWGIGAAVSAARTGGSCTVELYVNDVASGLQAVLDAGATTATWEDGEVTFEAGDALSLYYSTTSWGPTSADLQASIEVALG